MKGNPTMKAHSTSAALSALTLSLVLAAANAGAQSAPSPYAGEQSRAIKALSERELTGLLEGQGTGFAKAAELNGYPGPLHTLELKDRLGLTPEQTAATAALMTAHKASAREIGAALVGAERQLDELFAAKRADPAAVDQATRNVALLQARLRAEHLNTHIAQTALLSAEQIQRYSVLRGYGDAAPSEPAPGRHKH
jgi:Spy/CpxP family protein refolding chaperone